MRPDEAEQASQSVQRLDHAGDERGVAAVARKELSDGGLEAADDLFGLLLFLIGHDSAPWKDSTEWRSIRYSVESFLMMTRFVRCGQRIRGCAQRYTSPSVRRE